MSLIITVKGRELYDSKENRFYDVPDTKLVLEHSLLSVSKWEAKWHKPYLLTSEAQQKAYPRTKEEEIDYIRCMTVNGDVDPKVYLCLSSKNLEKINKYINDPMTATTFTKSPNGRPSREVITNELIYYWMTSYSIPFDPCQKWHLNRLMTLIEVCAVKNAPPKKMSAKSVASQYSAINKARRAKYNTRG